MQADIWVLADHRIGTATQAIAIAENLKLNSGFSFEIKRLHYNFLAHLPNFLLGATTVHIDKSASSSLTEPLPKIIISAGRRAASVALALKSLGKNLAQDIKIIHIMRPFLDIHKFDLIILPQHDDFKPSPNIFRIIGSIHNASDKMKQSSESFKKTYPAIGRFIALCIGGSTKNYTFSTEDAMQVLAAVVKISRNHGLPVFISFSRRTPPQVKAIFRDAFDWPHIIYDPLDCQSDQTAYNPYYGMLAQCSFLIMTCDSISMCSEATASGRPIYIYCPKKANMPKHKYFVQQLVDLKIARLLEPSTETLEDYNYVPFNESLKVANFIKENIL
ncbi:MAG: ELM1/GtrOC1 family putative glycosyltransferase [Pseudomonadota bacterium]